MAKQINPYDRSLKILARLYPEIFLGLVLELNEDIEVKESHVREYFKEELKMIKKANIVQEWIDEGIQQGIQQGMLQEAKEAVIANLEVRFKNVPESIVKTLNEINDSSILKILHRKAVIVKSLEEFRQVIDLMLK